MNDIAFADATRPARSVILKLLMLDYSIGHELILLSKRNPLVCLSEDAFNELPALERKNAIIFAATLCSQNWKDNSFVPTTTIQGWREILNWQKVGKLVKGEDFALAIADFRNYRAAGSTFPAVLPNEGSEGKGRQYGSPFLARLLQHVQRDYDCPLGVAMWLYFSQAEIDGACRIENDLEKQIREEIEQHKADLKREQEALKNGS